MDDAGIIYTYDWSTMDFADQEIIDAFQYSGFQVEYYNYASEISDLKLHDPAVCRIISFIIP